MTAVFVNVHFAGFEIIELFSNIRLVFWSQPGPRFVSSPIILVAWSHFDVVTKLDDLKPGR